MKRGAEDSLEEKRKGNASERRRGCERRTNP